MLCKVYSSWFDRDPAMLPRESAARILRNWRASDACISRDRLGYGRRYQILNRVFDMSTVIIPSR